MKAFTQEHEVWSHLADDYDKEYKSGICTALIKLNTLEYISGRMLKACCTRLLHRYKPQWWNFWRSLNLPYYWRYGDSKVRAKACNTLFFEAFEEYNG